MNTIEEKIGYLVAKMEEQGSDLKTLTMKMDVLEKRVDEKFRTAETVFRILKFLGLAALAILSFKFGDVSRLWTHFFG